MFDCLCLDYCFGYTENYEMHNITMYNIYIHRLHSHQPPWLILYNATHIFIDYIAMKCRGSVGMRLNFKTLGCKFNSCLNLDTMLNETLECIDKKLKIIMIFTYQTQGLFSKRLCLESFRFFFYLI